VIRPIADYMAAAARLGNTSLPRERRARSVGYSLRGRLRSNNLMVRVDALDGRPTPRFLDFGQGGCRRRGFASSR